MFVNALIWDFVPFQNISSKGNGYIRPRIFYFHRDTYSIDHRYMYDSEQIRINQFHSSSQFNLYVFGCLNTLRKHKMNFHTPIYTPSIFFSQDTLLNRYRLILKREKREREVDLFRIKASSPKTHTHNHINIWYRQINLSICGMKGLCKLIGQLRMFQIQSIQ